MADAISANTQLAETYFNSLHKYRLEWMPGDEGYIRYDNLTAHPSYLTSDGILTTISSTANPLSLPLLLSLTALVTLLTSHLSHLLSLIRWYLDDEFIYGIRANALNETGAVIPEEPMYILLNTAISSTWGFPQVNNTYN